MSTFFNTEIQENKVIYLPNKVLPKKRGSEFFDLNFDILRLREQYVTAVVIATKIAAINVIIVVLVTQLELTIYPRKADNARQRCQIWQTTFSLSIFRLESRYTGEMTFVNSGIDSKQYPHTWSCTRVETSFPFCPDPRVCRAYEF